MIDMDEKFEKELNAEIQRGCFDDFVATRQDFSDGMSVVNWQNKLGKYAYFVRFVFDKQGGTITISGVLGYAVVLPTWDATPEETVKHIGNTHYFMEKIRASSDLWDFRYDSAYDEIIQTLGAKGYDDIPEDDLVDEYMISSDTPYSKDAFYLAKALRDNFLNSLEELAEVILAHFDRKCGVTHLNAEAEGCLRQLGHEPYKFINDLGRMPSVRIGLWGKALEMAMDQLSGKDTNIAVASQG